MSVSVLVPLKDEDADHFVKMAEEAGISLGQLCASILIDVARDDRAAHKRDGDVA